MKKISMIVTMLLFVFSFFACSTGEYVDIVNETGYDIYVIQVSHHESDDWEEDVLGADILEEGETLRVTLTNYPDSIFDIRLTDEDGDTYTFWKYDISSKKLVVTLNDMD